MKKQKLSKVQKTNIRGPLGRFASKEQVNAVLKAKQENPRKTYKELSKQWIEKNHVPEPVIYRDPETKQILSKQTVKDVRKASRELGLSFEQALSIATENRLIQVQSGNIMLHSLLANVSALSERKDDFKIQIKHEGENRYKNYSVSRGLNEVNRIVSKIFKDLRKLHGKKLDSDKIPLIPFIQKIRPGNLLPDKISLNFNKLTTLADLDEDETEEIDNEIYSQIKKSKQDAKTKPGRKAKAENKNNSGNRKTKHAKPDRRTKKK